MGEREKKNRDISYVILETEGKKTIFVSETRAFETVTHEGNENTKLYMDSLMSQFLCFQFFRTDARSCYALLSSRPF